jgi:osmotically-inducible protein OsmY
MSRPKSAAPALALAVLFALCALLFLATGCGGGESEERELEEATALVVERQRAVHEAREEVDVRQAAVDQAQQELDAAMAELRAREGALLEAKSHVGLKATDATLFRSVQRNLLDDESLEGLAIAVRVTKGVVALEGTVPEADDRVRAEEIARATPGVVNLENLIEVVPPAPEE